MRKTPRGPDSAKATVGTRPLGLGRVCFCLGPAPPRARSLLHTLAARWLLTSGFWTLVPPRLQQVLSFPCWDLPLTLSHCGGRWACCRAPPGSQPRGPPRRTSPTWLSAHLSILYRCCVSSLKSFGGKNLRRVGIILQRGILILVLCCFPCWALFINTEHILLLLKQDPEVSRSAAPLNVRTPGSE